MAAVVVATFTKYHKHKAHSTSRIPPDQAMQPTSLILFCASFLLAIALAQGQAYGGLCYGAVYSNFYNLQPLAAATGGRDQSCQDTAGNTYYYRPCQPLALQQCQTSTDPTPASCQKDTRKIPQYHDCGSTTQVLWYVFFLLFL